MPTNHSVKVTHFCTTHPTPLFLLSSTIAKLTTQLKSIERIVCRHWIICS